MKTRFRFIRSLPLREPKTNANTLGGPLKRLCNITVSVSIVSFHVLFLDQTIEQLEVLRLLVPTLHLPFDIPLDVWHA
jgi:hypothetical protein